MNSEAASFAASEAVSNGHIKPGTAPVRARVVQAELEDGLLTPLEAALVAEIRGNGAAIVAALSDLKSEIRAVRDNPPFRWVPWAMLLLWLCNMFVIGILALERGVDPLKAAEAVKTLTPAVPVSRAP